MDKLKLKPEIVCLKLSNNCLHSFSANEVKDSILTRYTFLNSKHFSITSLDNSINLLISSRCSFSIKVKSKVDNVDEINWAVSRYEVAYLFKFSIVTFLSFSMRAKDSSYFFFSP